MSRVYSHPTDYLGGQLPMETSGTICLKCGWLNPPTSSQCSQCNMHFKAAG